MTGPVLDLVQVSARTRLWLWLLAGVLPVIAVGALLGHLAAQGELTPGTALLLFVTGVVPLWLLGLVVNHQLRRHRLALDPKGLRVVTGSHRVQLALSELDLERARVLDLHERQEFTPRPTLNGAFLPGFQSGWYRLRDGSRALVARAGGSRVLWIPTARDFGLLLQPRRPQELLRALREAADPGTGSGVALPADEAKQYWFPAKLYGWGWGFPSAWQGWLALGLYLVGVSLLFLLTRDEWTIMIGMVTMTAVLVLICFIKGEPPRWRWGTDDGD